MVSDNLDQGNKKEKQFETTFNFVRKRIFAAKV